MTATLTPTEARVVMSRDHWQCVLCGTTRSLHARRSGLLLRRQDLPEDVPVRVWTPDGHTLTHLTHDGTKEPA